MDIIYFPSHFCQELFLKKCFLLENSQDVDSLALIFLNILMQKNHFYANPCAFKNILWHNDKMNFFNRKRIKPTLKKLEKAFLKWKSLGIPIRQFIIRDYIQKGYFSNHQFLITIISKLWAQEKRMKFKNSIIMNTFAILSFKSLIIIIFILNNSCNNF